ncbi:MAG: hypothetical protein U0176_25600 [Bacteroidia bacterium]
MRKFDVSFRNDLRKKVEAVESDSGTELVVAILPRSSWYLEYYLGLGAGLAFLVLTVMMFIPFEIWYVYIYFETIGVGIIGGGLPWLIRPLLRWIVGKKVIQKRTDRYARAIFHKANIHETRERVGVLVTLFWLERVAIVMPDKGVVQMVPPDELEALEVRFNKVFLADDPPADVLLALDAFRETMAKYVPAETHPVNELPDDLWIE